MVQETFFNVWTDISMFRGDCKLYTWVAKILINNCLDFIRKNKKLLFLSSLDMIMMLEVRRASSGRISHGLPEVRPLFAEDILDPEEQAIKKLTSQEITNEIGRLKDVMRQAMILRYSEDLDVETIARILKLNENTLKVMLFRGRQKLRNILDGAVAT
jgi:RNA polymerase sigma-70 factor (ECF subfamily)